MLQLLWCCEYFNKYKAAHFDRISKYFMLPQGLSEDAIFCYKGDNIIPKIALV